MVIVTPRTEDLSRRTQAQVSHGLLVPIRGTSCPGKNLDDAMAKRAAYEAQISNAKARANPSNEPVAFPSATLFAT